MAQRALQDEGAGCRTAPGGRPPSLPALRRAAANDNRPPAGRGRAAMAFLALAALAACGAAILFA